MSVSTEMNDMFQPLLGTIETADLPRWIVMWTLAGSMFLAAKAITVWDLRRHGRRIPARRTAAYLLLWVGMDPRSFSSSEQWMPDRSDVAPGAVKLALGAFLLWGVAPMFNGLTAGWLGMIGMVLILHFGLFHILAVLWARRGVAVEPIMNRPLRARTLAEFWGERWNRAFNELMHRFVFRPALKRLGLASATLLVFFVSGLIHDFVISAPAGGGYGLPTLYFIVQGAALLVQRTRAARRLGMARDWVTRAFTFVVLLAPLPLLFHEPFVTQVILPFMNVI